MMKWNPKRGEFLKSPLEPENEFDKFAVPNEKYDFVVVHLSKGKTGRLAKNYSISLFLRGSNENSCKVEVTGRRVNLGFAIEKEPKYLENFIILEIQNTLTS